MIAIRTQRELELLRTAGRITRDTLIYLGEHIKPGIRTDDLNALANEYIRKAKAKPAFLNYNGYPKSVCVSPDDIVVHGIPGPKRLEEGMIVSIDTGAVYEGYVGDSARTYAVGRISAEKQRLIDVTRECCNRAAQTIRDGARIGDISAAVQTHAESNGYGVVRALEGHGIGRDMHEDPGVPNFGKAGTGVRLKSGMVICVEPMINMGTWKVKFDADGWACRTADGQPSAHYENMLAVTEDGCENLTE
ncbi:MAG: type I methionyl aminopeptidase [Clostridiales bacterium]|jgi:methionyl aminopeptidase|nr:type I methionyl aminopeptidase [Clostridiales bacterium]